MDLYTKHSKASIFLLVQNGSEEWQVTRWAKLSSVGYLKSGQTLGGKVIRHLKSGRCSKVDLKSGLAPQGGSEEWPTSYKVDLKSG
jgi:hypothetical protein